MQPEIIAVATLPQVTAHMAMLTVQSQTTIHAAKAATPAKILPRYDHTSEQLWLQLVKHCQLAKC